MKSLKPSMKENKRYLLLKGKDLKKNVERAISEFVGIKGLSEASPVWIKEGKEGAILSVNRGALDAVRASFCVFSERIRVEKISGTLKKLKE